jgi:hypothetical protein
MAGASDGIISKTVMKYLWRLLGNPIFSTQILELTYKITSRKKLKKAVKVLEKNRIWYRLEWEHSEEKSFPGVIIVRLDTALLEKK